MRTQRSTAIRSSEGTSLTSLSNRRACGGGQDLQRHLRPHPTYKNPNDPVARKGGANRITGDEQMTMKDKLEGAFFGAILIIGLPALMAATSF
jgi:hypothetical protein